MKSISNSSVSFGLVNIGVKVVAATDSHGVSFHQHHGGACMGSISYQRACKECGEEVAYGDIVKATETEDGTLVTVTGDELAEARDSSVAGIQVVQFCGADEIPPMINGATYYLEPNVGKGRKAASIDGYLLLRTVLGSRVAVVRYVLRDTPHLGVIRVDGKVLVLQQLSWFEDIRQPAFPQLDKDVELDPRMLKAASTLVDSMVAPFVHAAFEDSYSAAVAQLIADKAAGVQVSASTETDEATADVSDLLAKLEASIAAKDAKAEAKARHPSSRCRKSA